MDTATIIEYIGVAIGLAYLILEYKASFWLWPVGILMSLFYIVIFFQSKFYADAGIYTYYLGANLYGLIEWRRNSQKTSEKSIEMPITHTPKGKILPLTLIGLAIWAALWLLLSHLTIHWTLRMERTLPHGRLLCFLHADSCFRLCAVAERDAGADNYRIR